MEKRRVMTIKEAMMATDMDLFVNMINNDEGHIKRSKEKAARYKSKQPLFKSIIR